ncbi:MAG TPA: CPBP family glutamic-type intramembrane protease [Symbiobacteriaceae bacterium]|nr:CPBP family glutamic-type intramembrane protease [Symbiobacteriaceae bacterium]
MQLNRFWSAVWAVTVFLVSVGLLNVLIASLAGLVTLFAPAVGQYLIGAVEVVVPVIGAILYMDWRWGWKPGHIGMAPEASVAAWLVGGLAAGVAGAYLMQIASHMLSGPALVVTAPALNPDMRVPVLALLSLFSVELAFRGAAISKLKASLSPREVMLAAPLVPFGWIMVSAVVGRFLFIGNLSTGIAPSLPWTALLSIFLSLLYMRIQSVWLSAGIHMGVLGAFLFLDLQVSANGGMVVWGAAALVLLALEWFRQERMPKRIPPKKTYQGGRTVRGPWGPH